MTDREKLEKVRAEIERRYNEYMAKDSELATIRADECLGILSFIDSMQKEPVSEKECMYSKDNYTDEDRKVLCDGCEEECEFNKKEEHVSEIDFEQGLYKYFGQVKDFTLGMRIAKRFYEIGRNHQEPVSEDLEEAAQRYNEDMSWCWEAPRYPHLEAFKAGALWQKQQMIAKAVDATVHIDAGGYPYIPQMELYDYDKDIPFAKEGDKYKVILIKEG